MTSYAYDINDATLADIRELINRTELENNPIMGTSTFIGDAVTTQWYVAKPGFYIVPPTFSVRVNDEAALYTLDSTTGIVTMTSTPPADAECICKFTALAFPDFQVDAAINSALNNLFPYFWIAGNEIVTSNGSTYEYEMPEAVEVVTSIDYQSASSGGWSRRSRQRYSVDRDGNALVIRFFTAPDAGSLRFHTVSRPETFSSEDDALSSLGLPTRAIDPIISGAVYHLLMNKSAVRIRTDVAVATMGTGTVFPSMMAQVASNWLMRFQFQMQSVKMRPWKIR